jgi:hypothetical protein
MTLDEFDDVLKNQGVTSNVSLVREPVAHFLGIRAVIGDDSDSDLGSTPEIGAIEGYRSHRPSANAEAGFFSDPL